MLSKAYINLGSCACLCHFHYFQYPFLHGQAIAFDSSVAPCLPGHCLCMVNLVAGAFIYVLCDLPEQQLLFTSAEIYSCCSLMHES